MKRLISWEGKTSNLKCLLLLCTLCHLNDVNLRREGIRIWGSPLLCILSINLKYLTEYWKVFSNRNGKCCDWGKSRNEAGLLFWDVRTFTLGPQSGESLEPSSDFLGEGVLFTAVCQKTPTLDGTLDSAEIEMFEGVYSSRTSSIWMCSVVKAMALIHTEAIMWLIGIKTTIHRKHLMFFLKLKHKHLWF